ncbi:MAG: FMN-binding negative transcriptional regulator [Chitinophagales bacterium]
MYIPKHYEEKDLKEVEALVREFGFATLISTVEGKPWATHLPLELGITTEGIWLLHGHISRVNPQYKGFSNEVEVLAIFMGPHTYVSPSWYSKPNVPTWNYKAVHLYGKPRILEGVELEERLKSLMSRYENAHAEKPLAYEDVPQKVKETDLRGLIGFEIEVTKIEAASKLSQNRDAESHANIINELKHMDAYDAKRIAEEMEKRAKNSSDE